tara:strand:+ start:16119 stop:16382 length:264 start_codon:yes stop_codon:yes gene_type:complete
MSDSIKKWHEINEERGWVNSSSDFNHLPKDFIVEQVINKMRARSRDGILKYNTTLHDSPDGFYIFLNHLQEELMDAVLYIEKLKKLK